MNKQELMRLAIEQARDMLRPEVYAELEQDRLIEYGLSRIMSLATDYDGSMILRAAQLGLENVNWHPEAKILNTLIGE